MNSRAMTWATAAAVLGLSWFLLWHSAARDPLFPPDEGRYSAASVTMAEGGSWLIPVFEGEPHLTKPPLTYWAQAACLRLLGHNELAVRLPSLVASSLTLLLLMWFGARVFGIRTGILATATLGIMPLFIIVGRLAITDPMLNLFWLSALTFGYLAVQTGAARWAALCWLAVALGLITKGPLALVPVALLALWLMPGKRWDLLRRLRTSIGLPLALVPLGVWIWLVTRQFPDPFSIWYRQIVARALGTGDHSEPVWYYVPVFLVGLLPGTAMLVIPGLNISWRSAWQKLRNSEPATLWALSVIVPLVMFTLMSGKLAHYLLPLCAPLGLLTGMTLERWLSGAADQAQPGERPPEVVATCTVCATLIAMAAFGFGYWLDRSKVWLAMPLALPLVACIWMWTIWHRRPGRRGMALCAAWLAASVAWMWALKLGEDIRGPRSAPALMARLRELSGHEQPRIAVFGFRDATIQFYDRYPVIILDAPESALSIPHRDADDLVLLIDAKDWTYFLQRCPQCRQEFQRVGEWTLWYQRQLVVLRPTAAAIAGH